MRCALAGFWAHLRVMWVCTAQLIRLSCCSMRRRMGTPQCATLLCEWRRRAFRTTARTNIGGMTFGRGFSDWRCHGNPDSLQCAARVLHRNEHNTCTAWLLNNISCSFLRNWHKATKTWKNIVALAGPRKASDGYDLRVIIHASEGETHMSSGLHDVLLQTMSSYSRPRRIVASFWKLQ